jgi:hypothetical protein
VRLKGNAGDLGEARSGEGRRGLRRLLCSRWSEEEERKEEGEAPTGGVGRSVREREGGRKRAELAAEGGVVRELGRAWEGEMWAARGKSGPRGGLLFYLLFFFNPTQSI